MVQILSITHSNVAQPFHPAQPSPLSSSASPASVNAKSARCGCAQQYDTAHIVLHNQCIPLGLLPNAD